MKRIFIILSLTLAIVDANAVAEPNAPLAAIKAKQDKNGPLVTDILAEPIQEVILRLAKEAKVNLVISSGVKGNITLRLVDKTPLEVIQVVCEVNSNVFYELKGVYYVKTADEARKEFHPSSPWVPVMLANFKRQHYQELIKAGFSKDQALKIVCAEPLLKEIPLATK